MTITPDNIAELAASIAAAVVIPWRTELPGGLAVRKWLEEGDEAELRAAIALAVVDVSKMPTVRNLGSH